MGRLLQARTVARVYDTTVGRLACFSWTLLYQDVRAGALGPKALRPSTSTYLEEMNGAVNDPSAGFSRDLARAAGTTRSKLLPAKSADLSRLATLVRYVFARSSAFSRSSSAILSRRALSSSTWLASRMLPGLTFDLQRSDERAIGLRGHVDSFGECIGLTGIRHLRFLLCIGNGWVSARIIGGDSCALRKRCVCLPVAPPLAHSAHWGLQG
jgi:hypothetical protein